MRFNKIFFLFLVFLTTWVFGQDIPDSPAPSYHLKGTRIRRGIHLFQEKEGQAIKEKQNQLNIDLRNPHYQNGELSTTEGGVIQNNEMRIQAKEIHYIRKTEKGLLIHKIIAKEDLLLQYKGKVYAGEQLEYDLISRSGIITNGKTYASPWYFIGKTILMSPDESFTIYDASLTTCENIDSTWDLHAQEVSVQKKEYLKAKHIGFRFFKVPTLWLPTLKMNLNKFFSTPMIRYKVDWDRGRPRISMRYELYSWKNFACYLRGDYRFKTGFGGALETEYYPSHKRTSFETKNYLATDILENDPQKKRRFRLQGAYHSFSSTKKTHIDLLWDKYSDIDMPGDFRSDDFEINTDKNTQAIIHHREKDLISQLSVRPKINSFASLTQELPSVYMTMRPIDIQPLGIISYNWTKCGYVDYSYSDRLSHELPDFHSARLETHHELYRPFRSSLLSLTPFVGVSGIYYNINPCANQAVGLGAIHYGCDCRSYLHRFYKTKKHIIEPYVDFSGWTTPTSSIDGHYIFSINDGYNRINEWKMGIRQFVFPLHKARIPFFEADLFASGFMGDPESKVFIPKGYLHLLFNLSSIRLITLNGWNFNHQRIDYSNIRLGWTANEDFAASVEFRHRSKYDWRKSDHENYILDVSRSEECLLSSPLSDRRNTVLTNIFIRLTPLWTCHLQSHTGWDRWQEGYYNEIHVDLVTFLSSNWKVRFSYQHSQRDDRVTASIFLVKK